MAAWPVASLSHDRVLATLIWKTQEQNRLPGGGDDCAAALEPDGPTSAVAPLAAAGWAPALPSTAEVCCRQAVMS